MFIIGFNRLKKNIGKYHKTITFSIIIPFRNEAKNLPFLLDSVAQLSYPSEEFEVILVDDDSSDTSVQLIEAFQLEHPKLAIKIIVNNRYSNSPKKDAISIAIQHAKFNWIISTDADCILPESWLKCYANCIDTHNPNMVVGPVSFISNKSFLQQFQLIDFLSMQGATIGGFGIKLPFMSNGANFAYKKNVFLKLNGFESNNTIASGDDVFLLENFLNHQKEKVLFLKNRDALVTTYPATSWKDLVNQRKRWAAKATHFKSNFTKAIGLVVFLSTCASILALILAFFQHDFIWVLVLKYSVDTYLIFKTARLYQQKIQFISYCNTVFFYPFFTSYIALTSMLTSFEWKDRAFKK
jgi:cellulose synthase/poly-beta-1,6-N-acetylglucosamine synthase-like glycosyltransferase